MGPNPFLGVIFHWIGGLAAASFYLPYRSIKRWSWETYWLVGGVFSWIVAPIIAALLFVPGVWGLIRAAPTECLLWAYGFGVLWGIGGLTFGLTMRYLGLALGMAVVLGYCAVFGTLIPPIVSGEIHQIVSGSAGQVILLGIAVCVAGIAISGAAGMSKERELSPEEKTASIQEFDFKKGMIVATFSGIMSSCFAYGLTAGKPLSALTKASLAANHGLDLWQNLPVLIIVLLGGFTTNFLWCVYLNLKNRTAHEYLALNTSVTLEASALEAVALFDANDIPHQATAVAEKPAVSLAPVPLAKNYLLAAIAGITWYLQFFFYSMGQTKMGRYDFSSWTLHMASIIIFGTFWGISLHEWKGTGKRTHLLRTLGLFVLIGSTIIIGYGNYLNAPPKIH